MEPNMVYQNLMRKSKNLCVPLIFFEDSKTVACLSGTNNLAHLWRQLPKLRKEKVEIKDLKNKITGIIIHSKYFPDSDCLKAHV